MNKYIYISIAIIVIALILSIKMCGDANAKYEDAKDYIENLNDSLIHLKNGVVKQTANEVDKNLLETIVKENSDLKKALSDANIKIKNAKTITRVITKTEIGDPITIRLTDSIPCPAFNPIDFKAENNDYSISGSVNKSSVRISKISFPDSLYVITAYKKHVFKNNEYNVLIKHSNPLIKTVGAMNLTVTDKKRFWDIGWFKIGVGFVAGSFLTYEITK